MLGEFYNGFKAKLQKISNEGAVMKLPENVVLRVRIQSVEVEKPCCEFCGKEYALGFKLCMNHFTVMIYVCDACLQKAKKSVRIQKVEP